MSMAFSFEFTFSVGRLFCLIRDEKYEEILSPVAAPLHHFISFQTFMGIPNSRVGWCCYLHPAQNVRFIVNCDAFFVMFSKIPYRRMCVCT